MSRPHWVLTADEQAGRLLKVDRTPTGRASVVMDEEIHESWEEREHGRPSPRAGKRGHSYASRGHEEETRRDRFAREVAVWLERRAERLHIERIAVFAPPRFLGALREAWSPRMAMRVDEHHGDLTRMSRADLAAHSAILSVAGRD